MKLDMFLKESNMSVEGFAELCGLDEKTVRNLLKGKDVTLSVAILIEEFTHKIVKCSDLAPIKKLEKRKSKSAAPKEGEDLSHS